MSYSIKNLMNVTNNKSKTQGAGIPNKWVFYNADSDTVTDAGFIEANNGVKAGDQVEVIAANYASHAYYYAVVSSGVITLTAY